MPTAFHWRASTTLRSCLAPLRSACFLLLASLCIAPGLRAQAPVAEWRMGGAGPEEHGLRLLSGEDGVVAVTAQGGARCASDAPGSSYLYFRITDPTLRAAHGPVYLTIEYYDGGMGGALAAHYNSDLGTGIGPSYQLNEDGAGGLGLGRKAWETAALELERPHFTGRQNLGADFRLTGLPLYIRSVRLTRNRPASWAALGKVSVAALKPLVKIGKGGELIVGGFDPNSAADARGQVRALEANIPALKQLGVTSHEVYVRWNLCEVAPGRFDWSTYDRYVALYRKYHIKWVPFIIAGPAYTLPDWYYKSKEKHGYVCLEHGKESDIQSLWNPAMRRHVERFLRAFAAHYRDSGVVESLLLGITGNYGEAIYPASGNDWTADVHGPYHTHPGFWAGDAYAVQSFRAAMKRKYRRIGRLNGAWGTSYPSFAAVKTFDPSKSRLTNRAKLDFIGWYIGSMTDWARFWMSTTRAAFPKAEIYLCTGGHAPPEHGSDFGDQCKLAASLHAGVRITNEASDYALNFALTRWVASAARQYGAYFSFEPAGAVDPAGVVARIYNATASGAKGLHYYYPNILGSPAARQNFVANAKYFQQRRPLEEVAVYYPETDIRLTGDLFFQRLQPLRDRFDFNVASDGQIADGGLSRYKALILLHGTVAEAGTWRRIADWVRRGGLLLTADGLGRLTTVEGKPSALAALLAPGARAGRGRVVTFHGDPATAEYRAYLSKTLAGARELSPLSRAAVAADGREDGIFVTAFRPGGLLWLNMTARPVERRVGKQAVRVAPAGIAAVRFGTR